MSYPSSQHAEVGGRWPEAAVRLCFTQGRHDDAIRHYEKPATLMETDFSSVAMLETCYKAVGDAAGARHAASRTGARAERIAAQEPDNGMAMGYVVGALATLEEAERATELAERAMLLDPDNLTMLYNFACAFLKLREVEMALDVLGPVLEKDTAETVNWAKVDPDLDPLRGHPRLRVMMAKADARLAAISAPDFAQGA